MNDKKQRFNSILSSIGNELCTCLSSWQDLHSKDSKVEMLETILQSFPILGWPRWLWSNLGDSVATQIMGEDGWM